MKMCVSLVLASFLVPSVCFGGGDQAESSCNAQMSTFSRPLNEVTELKSVKIDQKSSNKIKQLMSSDSYSDYDTYYDSDSEDSEGRFMKSSRMSATKENIALLNGLKSFNATRPSWRQPLHCKIGSYRQSLRYKKCRYCDSDLQFALCTATALNCKEGWEKFIIAAGQMIERRGTKTIYRGPGAQTVVVTEKREGNDIIRTIKTSKSQRPGVGRVIEKERIHPDGSIHPLADLKKFETRVFSDCTCCNRYWESPELENVTSPLYMSGAMALISSFSVPLTIATTGSPAGGLAMAAVIPILSTSFFDFEPPFKLLAPLYKCCDGCCNCDQ